MTTNCSTATGTVHTAIVERDGRPRPACSGRTVNGMHYCAPTEREVTCLRCLSLTVKAQAEGPSSYAKASAAAEAHATKVPGEITRKVVATNPANGYVVTRVAETGAATFWTVQVGEAPVHYVGLTRADALRAAGL